VCESDCVDSVCVRVRECVGEYDDWILCLLFGDFLWCFNLLDDGHASHDEVCAR